MNWKQWLSGVIGLATIVVLGSGVAHARSGVAHALTFGNNFCVEYPTGWNFTFVGQDYSFPDKNECRSWNGFTNYNGYDSPSTGTGCLSDDGKTFNLTLVTTSPANGGVTETDSITIAITDENTGTGTDIFSGTSSGGPDSVQLITGSTIVNDTDVSCNDTQISNGG